MSARRLFGTDGVRGVANEWPMTVETALKIGQGAASVFRSPKRRAKIIIGKDTRLSGYMIENAIAAGICSMGVDVMLCGPLPTPGIAFLTRSMRCDAGVVISASHNSFEYNGIKLFSRHGFKLADEVEATIEAHLFGDESIETRAKAGQVGKAFRIEDARGRYIVFLKNAFPDDLTLDGLSLVMDCAHGATYKVAPAVMEELGAKIIVVGDEPDGENINRDCGSLHVDHVVGLVPHYGADVGLAFDGDGDRVIMVDDKGRIVDGDRILGILAPWLKRQGRLTSGCVVGTVMTNMGLEVMLREQGIDLVRTQVGDRYVVEEMLKRNCNIGGEQSGHIIFLDHNSTGDGIISALQVLSVMKDTGRPLSELADCFTAFPQVLINVTVKEQPDIFEVPALAKAAAAAEEELGSRGRLLIRYSGTEPLLRVMVEGEDDAQINRLARELAEIVARELGA
ncbi:MAG: phosphoglucosamine mutase [Proteobacteria bacterium]|nr:phosphoglucosamine mutase [Pseudomonadota bacterium]